MNEFALNDQMNEFAFELIIYSQLSRCSTASGSNPGLVPVGPTKVEGRKFILELF